MLKLFRNSEDLVKSLLEKYPQTRDNDLELIMKVWETQGLTFTKDQQELIRRCLSPETITRCRRKIQEMGLFRPSKKIQEQRSFLETSYTEYFRSNK